MYRHFALITISLLLGALSAGCIGGDDTPVPTDTEDGSAAEAAPTEDTGSVTGQVLTVELEPVPEAVVALTTGASEIQAKTTADKEGRYTINGVPPGEYRIQVTGFCCKAKVTTVAVEAGAVERMDIQLQRLSPAELQQPYMKENEWEGFIACGVGGGVPGVSNPKAALCAIPGVLGEEFEDPNEEFIHYFNMSAGLQDVVVGMKWDAVGGVSGRTFNLLFEEGICAEIACADAYTYADLNGGSPLYAHVRGEEVTEERAKFENMTTEEEFKFRVFVGDGYAEAVYQQPFTVYWHEFYFQKAPDGHNVFPDA